ncbi:MAG TPA: DUF255 domain-containing protein, partial [bacterium]|nr:DUF255 domain-containing protein [bacterium]
MTAFRAALLAVLAVLTGAARTEAPRPIPWQRQWSPALFEAAAREHRFVLLDLHAVWCHWCHVMDDQ